MADLRAKLLPETAMEVMKETRKLRKSFTRLSAIDFFPGAARDRIDTEPIIKAGSGRRGVGRGWTVWPVPG